MLGGHISFCFDQLGAKLRQMAVLVVMDKTYFLQMIICKNYWQYLPHQEALSWLTLAKGSTRKAGKRKAAKGAANACSPCYHHYVNSS